MIIEAGKYYKTRDGRKVGPMAVWEEVYERETGKPLYDCETEGGIHGSYWRENGLNGEPGIDPDPRLDLIAEWTDEQGPVVTERVKRIVPGEYGVVRIWEQEGIGMSYSIPGRPHSAAELRAASSVLLQLADALEESK